MKYPILVMLVSIFLSSCLSKSEHLPRDRKIVINKELNSYDSIQYLSKSHGNLKWNNNRKYIIFEVNSLKIYFSIDKLVKLLERMSELASDEEEILHYIKRNSDSGNIIFTLDNQDISTKSGIPIAIYLCEFLKEGKYFVVPNLDLYEVNYIERDSFGQAKTRRYIDTNLNTYWICPPIEVADFDFQ